MNDEPNVVERLNEARAMIDEVQLDVAEAVPDRDAYNRIQAGLDNIDGVVDEVLKMVKS